MDQLQVLKQLSEAIGVSGAEHEVRALISTIARDRCDEITTDALGNLIAVRRGSSDAVLMIDAHMDEVGFMVAMVEESGFIRLAAIGGWDPRVLLAQAITIRTRNQSSVRGVIGTVPPHMLSEADRNKQVPIDQLFVDIGASSAADVASLGVRVGDVCVPTYGFEQLGGDLVMGKAFDDRAGCTASLGVMDELTQRDLDITVAFTFTVCEEVGLRGARTAATRLSPVLALALEGTTAVDIPGVSALRRSTTMGGGPAITIADPSMFADRGVVDLLDAVAAEKDIRVQHKIPLYGGSTNAGAIHLAGMGCRAGVVSVPCRYLHTPLTLLRPSDLAGAVSLATGFVLRASTLLG